MLKKIEKDRYLNMLIFIIVIVSSLFISSVHYTKMEASTQAIELLSLSYTTLQGTKGITL